MRISRHIKEYGFWEGYLLENFYAVSAGLPVYISILKSFQASNHAVYTGVEVPFCTSTLPLSTSTLFIYTDH